MSRKRLAKAWEHAGRRIDRRDEAIEVAERATWAHALAARGEETHEIAVRLGVTPRTVERHLAAGIKPVPELPKLPDPRRITDTRADEMEQLADLAVTLVGELRDGDPVRVWLTLNGLQPRQLMELAVVALAMVPDDRSCDELLAWVAALPAAQPSMSA